MLNTKKIVLVLGNGFDLDLGLKTSYKDFWESGYCPKDYPSPIIRHLNSPWYKDLNTVRWYDLENELHSFAIKGDKSDVVSEQELEYIKKNSKYEFYRDYYYLGVDNCLNSLIEKGFIRIEDDKRGKIFIPYKNDFGYPVEWRTRRSLQLIKEGLCKYLKSLGPLNASKLSTKVSFNILKSISRELDADSSVEIFSFNYTHFPDLGIRLDVPVRYMHGSCESGKIVVGTRDDLSIEKDYDFLQKAMDPYFRPPRLVNSLKEADEVIVFGHSLGENDKQYFTPFFKHASSFDGQKSKYITIFTYDQTSEDDIKRSLNKMTDGNLSVLFSNNDLEFIKIANIAEDQQILLVFLLRHETDEHHARNIIGGLINREKK